MQEYLLTCLTEECAEVQQSCTKAIRFGLLATNPNTLMSNISSINAELTDLATIVELLGDELGCVFTATEEDKQAKKCKVRKWADYSVAAGVLDEG